MQDKLKMEDTKLELADNGGIAKLAHCGIYY